jgi:hypothetical protein
MCHLFHWDISNETINGLSRQGMARFLVKLGGDHQGSLLYCGGEIFAATQGEVNKLGEQVDHVWPRVLADDDDAPKEEAHLLSILYALNQYAIGTANAFIKRMWTTFKHNNVSTSDVDLAIWHLPSEKKSGFHRLFSKLKVGGEDYRDLVALGFNSDGYKSTMGIPRRNPAKWVRDFTSKAREHLFL